MISLEAKENIHRPDVYPVALTMTRRLVARIARYCQFLRVDDREVGQEVGGEEPTVVYGEGGQIDEMCGHRALDFKSNGKRGWAQGIRRNIQISCFGRVAYFACAPALRSARIGARSDTLIGRLKKYA